MFSSRTGWTAPINALTRARRARAAAGLPLVDLTASNPTGVGLPYPHEALQEAFRLAAAAHYEPDPRGSLVLRERIAGDIDGISADDLVLTASTSEAYGFLFKLLCNPGDEVITATPAYPLLAHLTALDAVRLVTVPLELDGRWSFDLERLESALTPRTRAIVVVNPNNPTGSYVRADEQDAIVRLCRSREIALISDEVFFDYPLAGAVARRSLSAEQQSLTFTLGGFSKRAGLPQWKLAWIAAGGPHDLRDAALDGLETIADHSLSVSTPVQHAAIHAYDACLEIRAAIQERTQRNLAQLETIAGSSAAMQVLPVEGGWSAVVRLPRILDDEEFAVALIDETGVLVHPGYFFDFASEGFIVLSLLPEPEIFSEGAGKIADFVTHITKS